MWRAPVLLGPAIARILVGSVPSEPRLPAAPSAPVYEIGDDGGSFGSAAAPSVGLCGVTSAAFLLLGAPLAPHRTGGANMGSKGNSICTIFQTPKTGKNHKQQASRPALLLTHVEI